MTSAVRCTIPESPAKARQKYDATVNYGKYIRHRHTLRTRNTAANILPKMVRNLADQ
ncbi:protein of unknown function [Nitrospira defluvii]|uniref:Uncharacterized protein n=1 Tax=Nitrospira defluvii TaxID=330214 RepID=D8PFC9_9BACT|nr:protein of unknown function [Nitrospira defluvii]